MSGGHWNYLSDSLRDIGVQTNEAWKLLSTLEHELDWGMCADTCLACAKIRATEALIEFFDTNCTSATTAVAIARDYKQNLCEKCQTREKERTHGKKI